MPTKEAETVDITALAKQVIREYQNLEADAPMSDDCGECTMNYLPHKQTCAYHLARAALAKAESQP